MLVTGTVLLLLLGVVSVIDSGRPPQGDAANLTGIDVVASDLDVPWGLTFLPDGDILVTERPGTLLRIDGETGERYPINGVRHVGEGGLLGVARHPDFAANSYIYLYMTTQDPAGSGLVNRVVRYTLETDRLSDPQPIITGIPGAVYHDGGRIAFGPENNLYITTGDSGTARLAQDRSSRAGKILRLNPDGSIPADNPFGTAVYSYGHRNPQGLAWDADNRLWSTEHGNDARDEINLVRAGANYGWPTLTGYDEQDGMRAPVHMSGTATTWAPAGATIIDGNLVFAGLRGQSLYVGDIEGNDITQIRRELSGDLGRLRAVEQGPNGYLYVSTSNTDGRGTPRENDDRILRIDPEQVLEQ